MWVAAKKGKVRNGLYHVVVAARGVARPPELERRVSVEPNGYFDVSGVLKDDGDHGNYLLVTRINEPVDGVRPILETSFDNNTAESCIRLEKRDLPPFFAISDPKLAPSHCRWRPI